MWFEQVSPGVGARIVWRRGLVEEVGGVPAVTWVPPLGSDPGVVSYINSLEFGVTPDLVTFRVVDQPSIAVDHTCVRKGWVYVCYASEVNRWSDDPNRPIEPNNPAGPCDPGNCQPDIFVSRYRYDPNDVQVDDFVWETVRVNDDDVMLGEPPNETPMRTVQVMPWVAVNDRGRVGVGFYDRRDDTDDDSTPTRWNKLQHYYLGYSVDGAGSFRPNIRVSDQQSDTHPSAGKMGEYTSFAGGPDGVFFGLWTDTRNFDPTRVPDTRAGDIYFARAVPKDVPPDFDGDCDVDMGDFGVFSSCFNGSNNPPAPSCPLGVDADFDADCDVDLADFGMFSACYNGADRPPSSGCSWGECGSAGAEGAMGSGGSDGDAGDEPTAGELYWLLYEYCQENGIPFT